MQVKLANYKDLKIKAQIEVAGKVHDVEVVKWDSKNNVIGFFVKTEFGKGKVYVGAGKESPKLTDLKNIVIELPQA